MQAFKRSYFFQITFQKNDDLKTSRACVRMMIEASLVTRILLALKNNFGIARMTSGDVTKDNGQLHIFPIIIIFKLYAFILCTLLNPTLMSSIHRWRG